MKKLKMSHHAKKMAVLRGITVDEINDAIKYGFRESRPGNVVLHADMKTHIGVIISWRAMVIVTVINISAAHYQKLWDLRRAQEKRDAR